MGFLGRGKKKGQEQAAPTAAAAGPVDPMQAAMGNDYVKHLMATDSHLTQKNAPKGAAAPTPDMIKALGAQMSAAKGKEKGGAKAGEAWSGVSPALQPDRLSPDLKLFNDIEDHRLGRDTARAKEAGIKAPAPASRPASGAGLAKGDGLKDESNTPALAGLMEPDPRALTAAGPAPAPPAALAALKEPEGEMPVPAAPSDLMEPSAAAAAPVPSVRSPLMEPDPSVAPPAPSARSPLMEPAPVAQGARSPLMEPDPRTEAASVRSPLMEPLPMAPPTTAPPAPAAKKALPKNGADFIEAGLGAGDTVAQVGGAVAQAERGAEVASAVDLVASAKSMDGSGVSKAMESTNVLGAAAGAGSAGIIGDGLGVATAMMKSERGKKLQDEGNTAQKQLGDTLVQRGDHETMTRGMSAMEGGVKLGVTGAKLAGDGIAATGLGNIVPGLGIATGMASLAQHSSAYDEAHGYRQKTAGAKKEIGEENPMSILAGQAESHHDKNKSRAGRAMALDTAGIAANVATIAAPPIGAMATGAVAGAKAVNAGAELAKDNYDAYQVQGARDGAAAGDRGAKRKLLKEDPRVLATGLGMYGSRQATEGESEEDAGRRTGAQKIMGAMGVTDRSLADGREEDISALVSERTRTSPEMLMSHQKAWKGFKNLTGIGAEKKPVDPAAKAP